MHASEYLFRPAPESGPGRSPVTVVFDNNRGPDSDVACAWRPTSDGYVLEFFIPAAALAPAKLQAGTVLGMNFAVRDDRKATERFFCDDTPENRRSPLQWGAVRLAR